MEKMYKIYKQYWHEILIQAKNRSRPKYTLEWKFNFQGNSTLNICLILTLLHIDKYMVCKHSKWTLLYFLVRARGKYLLRPGVREFKLWTSMGFGGSFICLKPTGWWSRGSMSASHFHIHEFDSRSEGLAIGGKNICPSPSLEGTCASHVLPFLGKTVCM